MPNARITGTGGFVPETVVSNEDLARRWDIDTNDDWIVQRTGIRERRFAEAGVNNSDLAVVAARRALDMAGLAPADLDMILYATLSPDQAFPGSGVLLQQKLGLCDGDSPRFVPAMDIRNQCSGFVYGLGTAAAMVQSGACRQVLVVGSELHSAALDLSTRGRSVASLFGDGAGAVVVSATDEDRGIRGWWLGADGRYADVLCQRIWDMTQRPFIPLDEDGVGRVAPELLWTRMDGRQVFRHAVGRMCEAVHSACQALEMGTDDVDLFLFHQANLRINQAVAKRLEIGPERFLDNIQRYGNTTAATLPLLLDEAVRGGRLQPGMRVALVAFGSGFTWGSVVLDW